MKGLILGFLLLLFVWIIQSDDKTPNAKTQAKKTTKNANVKEEVIEKYDDGLEKVYIYNKVTGEEKEVYRKPYEMKRRTKNIIYIDKTTSRNFETMEEFDENEQRMNHYKIKRDFPEPKEDK